MSVSHENFSQEDLNLLRNERIKFDCGPQVYHTILEWGFKKPKGVKIINHLEDLKIEEKCGRSLKSWLKKNEYAIEKEDFSSFDITTLHDLLSVLCYDKVSLTGGKEYEAKLEDMNSIEYLLREIKNFRNDVSHEYSKAIKDPNIIGLKILMGKSIRTAGALYGLDQSEINAKVAELDTKFDNIMQSTSSSYVNAVQYVSNKIERECPKFILKKYSPLFTVSLPGGLKKVRSSEIFESVNISIDVEDKDENKMVKDTTVVNKDDSIKNKLIFRYSEICNHVSNKFVVINGGLGSGKTTLMRQIFQNILENSVNGSETIYESIGRFRVPIYLECRTEQQNNIRDFLKENLRNINYSKEVIYEAFKNVTGQVFIIDGYDEVNAKSRELVHETLEFCSKYNATCIVSGRVDAGNDYISNLQERNLSYNEMIIEPISKMIDKLSFLRRYGDKMSDVDSNELVKSFENMNDSAQAIFFCPVLLALFISLFANQRYSLSQLHNELSTYKAIREMFSEEIEEKLKKNKVANPELRAKYLLEVFSDCSLRLFKIEKYFFEKKQFLSLSEDCLQKIFNYDVDIKWVFSCILTPETSLQSGKALTYAFTHSSIQEYLAVSRADIQEHERESNIDWNSEESLLTQFLKCLGVSASVHCLKIALPPPPFPPRRFAEEEDLPGIEEQKFYGTMKIARRYGNIIKLLILEFVENEELTKYTRTITAVFWEYFMPVHFYASPEYLFDLVYSSNCDFTLVSIVSNVLNDKSRYLLRYTRHIRPLTEVLKKEINTIIEILFNFSESFTDADSANLGQLVSVLKDSCEIRLHFYHSYDNYQPLNGKFYTHLKNSECDVTGFKACVMSSDHLSIVNKAYKSYGNLSISTVPTCDISFDVLEEYKGKIFLRVKYTEDCPSTGSNPISCRTILTIADIPADGKDNVYRILKYLFFTDRGFTKIKLVNCHLKDTDVNNLLKKLEGERIYTSLTIRTEVKEERLNDDKSRNLELHLQKLKPIPMISYRHSIHIERLIISDIHLERENKQRAAEQQEAEQRAAKQREAEQREAEQREAEQQEAEQRETEQREAEQREAEQRVAEQRKAEQGEAEQLKIKQREVEQREAEQRETEQRENEQREAEQREAEQRKAEQRKAEQREAEQREAEQPESEQREAEQREADQREAEQQEADQREAEQREAEQREAEQRKAEQREAEQPESEQREAEQQEVDHREAEQREAEQREAEQRKIIQREAEQRKAEQREAEKREVEQREAEKREVEQREAEQREAEQQETEQREAEQQETDQREAEQREAEQREAEQREAEQQETDQRESEQLEAEQREAEQREAVQREAEQREAEQRIAEHREAEQREAEKREVEQREAEQREAEQRKDEQQEAVQREAEQQKVDQREPEQREANQREAEQQKADQREPEQREAEQREDEQRVAQQREAEQREIKQREAEQREDEQREAEQREIKQREAEQREDEQREAEQREIKQREAEQREDEQREAQQREIKQREAEEQEVEQREDEQREVEQREDEQREAEQPEAQQREELRRTKPKRKIFKNFFKRFKFL